MNAMECQLIFKDEVFRIIGAAMEVSNHLGCGFLEAVYQEALGIEFADRRIAYEAQKRIEISYKDTVLRKKYVADFLCMDRIIVKRSRPSPGLKKRNFSTTSRRPISRWE